MSVDRLSRVGQTQSREAVLKGGDLFLQNISTPSTVRPGNSLNVGVTASNGAIVVNGAGNPDCCGPACGLPGTWATNGYTYEVVAELAGRSDSTGEHCLGTTEVGTFDRRHTLDLEAPASPGTYTLTLTLRLTGSGDSASTTRQVEVEEEDTGDGDGGDGGTTPPPDGEEDTIFGIPRNQAILGGSAVLIAGGIALSLRGESNGRRP